MKINLDAMNTPQESAQWLRKKLAEDPQLNELIEGMRAMAVKNLMIYPPSERSAMMWGMITAAMSIGYEVAMMEVKAKVGPL